MKTKRKINRIGFVSAVAIALAACIMISTGAIYFLLQNNIKHAVIMNINDRSALIADVGIQEAINLVRANPDIIHPYGDYSSYYNTLTTDGFYEIQSAAAPKILLDSSGKKMGKYSSKVKIVNWKGVFKDNDQAVINGGVHHIVCDGYAVNKNNSYEAGAVAHAYVYIPSIGKYFAAVKGGLIIGAGSDLSNAEIYGASLNFINLDKLKPIKLRGADYAQEIVNPNPWPNSSDTTLFGSIVINNDANNHPNQLPLPLVFPGIEEQFNYYSHSGAPLNCDFRVTDLYPPSVRIIYAASASPPAFPSITSGYGDKKYHAYYCNGVASIGIPGQTLKIHGQVIIAATQGIKINGNIVMDQPTGSVSQNNYTGPDGGITMGTPKSTADQLVLYSGQNVELTNSTIDYGAGNYKEAWCYNGVTQALDMKNLRIEGVLVVAPKGTIQDASVGVKVCTDYDNYSIDFQGAMFLNTQPQFLNTFKKTRTYSYLTTLRTDPPPTREFYQVLRYFVFRQPKAASGPVPTGTATGSPTGTP